MKVSSAISQGHLGDLIGKFTALLVYFQLCEVF